jgi:hypothetical protein
MAADRLPALCVATVPTFDAADVLLVGQTRTRIEMWLVNGYKHADSDTRSAERSNLGLSPIVKTAKGESESEQ